MEKTFDRFIEKMKTIAQIMRSEAYILITVDKNDTPENIKKFEQIKEKAVNVLSKKTKQVPKRQTNVQRKNLPQQEGSSIRPVSRRASGTKGSKGMAATSKDKS